ncbi:pyrroloquinoline quinone precursor peptide PqqA [Streptomyces sp. NPDC001351]
MNETLRYVLRAERPLQEERETSDENVWQSPGYTVVETALEVTAYALGDR